MIELRRQFRLPETDEMFLNGLGRRWETVVESGIRWLIIRDYPIPVGYNRTSVDVVIVIAPGYPPGPLDMAFFHPWLYRTDGSTIPAANSAQTLDGLSWQRWSRHRRPDNPWIEGEDDLASHIHYMEYWLAAELERI